MAEPTATSRVGIGEIVRHLDPQPRAPWGFKNLKRTISTLSQELGLTELLEIGGGRLPRFPPEEIAELGVHLTINDISQAELDRTPAEFATTRFDIGGDLDPESVSLGAYDLIYSRMVFEHVEDVEQAWRNVHQLLRPGGVAVNFFPTLYAPPFLLNLVLSEKLSRRVLTRFFPHRSDTGRPKFPAHYHWCFSSEKKMAPMLSRAGFDEVVLVPFYGSNYFKRVPVIRQLDNGLNRLARRYDWRSLSTYAYAIVRKAG